MGTIIFIRSIRRKDQYFLSAAFFYPSSHHIAMISYYQYPCFGTGISVRTHLNL